MDILIVSFRSHCSQGSEILPVSSGLPHTWWWAQECPFDGAVLQKRFGRGLNFLVNKFCPSSSPRTIACYILCSWVLFSYFALNCFKTANLPEFSAKSCWPRWLVFRSSWLQDGRKDATAVHTSTLHGRSCDGRKRWLSLVHVRSSSTYLHFYPACSPSTNSVNWTVLNLFKYFYQMLEHFLLVSPISFFQKHF